MTAFLQSLWNLTLDLAPWLVLGLVVAGLLKALIPTKLVARAMGGKGLGSMLAGAVLGAPLPLCSCSVLPVAVTLRRQGASRSSTAAFLISTPETGVDSVAVSYALLGPLLTIVRPIAAVISALAVGGAVTLTPGKSPRQSPENQGAAGGGAKSPTEAQAKPAGAGDACCGHEVQAAATSSCCEREAKAAAPAAPASSCCGHENHGGEADGDHAHDHAHCAHEPARPADATLGAKLAEGMRFAMTTLLDDLLKWMIVGLVLAALVAAFVPPDTLAQWGRGPLAMLVMAGIGIPMYVCATSSTPLAAALLLAGVSPGTVLVFLLAGPATNMATLGVLRQELGGRATAVYFVTLAGVSIALGMATDAAASYFHVAIRDEVSAAHGLVPAWLAIACLVVLVLAAIRPVRRWVLPTPEASRPQPA